MRARDATLGRAAVKRQDPFGAPASAAGGPSFGLIPALTDATKEERLELKLWRAAVREAYYRWLVDKSTAFPEGTYQVVVRYKARVVT